MKRIPTRLQWKTIEGSTGRLIELCSGYFLFYLITGISVKFFTGSPDPGMTQTTYLVYSTIGGNLICLVAVALFGWYRLPRDPAQGRSARSIPRELFYIIPSGICTAVVIPTTTLMYTLPISVMVAMVIMRSSIIVISRIVDAVQIAQGVLKRRVYVEENIAVVFALCAAAMNLAWVKPGDFDFVHSPAAMSILGSYICAYAVRIYLMNYFKNTRTGTAGLNNRNFFAIEQIAASIVMVAAGYYLFQLGQGLDAASDPVAQFRQSLLTLHGHWLGATFSGMAFGMVAFFSVFIFMFKGRTATFAGLVNRLTSLVAGTAATLGSFLLFGSGAPHFQDWLSLGFILVAVAFLTRAEKKRSRELSTGSA